MDSMIVRTLLCVVSLHYVTTGVWMVLQWQRDRRRERELERFHGAFLEQLATLKICVMRDYIEREVPPKTVGFQVPR